FPYSEPTQGSCFGASGQVQAKLPRSAPRTRRRGSPRRRGGAKKAQDRNCAYPHLHRGSRHSVRGYARDQNPIVFFVRPLRLCVSAVKSFFVFFAHFAVKN